MLLSYVRGYITKLCVGEKTGWLYVFVSGGPESVHINISMDRWIDGLMDRWIDGLMDQWIDGLMD